MESHLGALVEQAAARGKPLTALVIDIDYFKSINDSYGHDAGDDVLREFAARIKKSIRGIDLACRLGGEEFVIVMPETDMAVATHRRRTAAPAHRRPSRSRSRRAPSASRSRSRSGSPRSTPSTTTPPTILKRADQALYRAKRDGRNRVVADAA